MKGIEMFKIFKKTQDELTVADSLLISAGTLVVWFGGLWLFDKATGL